MLTMLTIYLFSDIDVVYLTQMEMILPDRAYAFFSHTHKAQQENMPLLDKVNNETLTIGADLHVKWGG